MRRFVVACLVLAIASAASTPVLADTATADLVAGPPPGAWQVDPHTGPQTKQDVYGAASGSVQQFVDSYHKVWTLQSPRLILADRLERYSSAIWAAFRFGESHGAARKNKLHSSVSPVSGLGPNAYETMDPADANGFLIDSIVFQQGDYLAVVSLYDMSQPDQTTLMDQAKRQYDLIPLPVAEYNSAGRAITLTIVIGALAALALAVIAGVIVLIVTRRNRAQQLQPPAGIPRGAPISPDGAYWWDGTAWRPRPPT